MEHFFRLASLITVTIFLGASEGMFFQRRQADASEVSEAVNSTIEWNDPSLACHSKKNDNCFVPYLGPFESQLSSPKTARVFIGSRRNVEQFAIAVQAVSSCVQNETLQPYCQNLTEQERTDREVAFVADFLASSENIYAVVDVSTSVCLAFPHTIKKVEKEFAGCGGTLFAELQQAEMAPCQAVDNLKSCLINSAASWCGAEAGVFVEKVWDHLVGTDVGRAFLEDTPLPAPLVNSCY